jgi:hypothetical protein
LRPIKIRPVRPRALQTGASPVKWKTNSFQMKGGAAAAQDREGLHGGFRRDDGPASGSCFNLGSPFHPTA